MPKLFMFYVGGSFANSNTELHDVRFSVGETVEDCHDDLRAQWWGTPASLHLDCWGAVEQADGHDVTLIAASAEEQTEKLFFVNLGGYDLRDFSELHRNVLLVAPDAATAKARAMGLVTSWTEPHRDQLLEVEQMVDISAAMKPDGLAIRLSPAMVKKPFSFECGYRPIGKDISARGDVDLQ